MCGIAGIVNCGDVDVLARMTDVQSHRGPDDRDVRWFPEERVGLGHRRLSIIDLSPAGLQPMANEDQQVWLVFNGEIYNFEDLRRELRRAGHRFRSLTDSEVLLHLYEDEGADCVRRLNGMFAFAVLDRREQKLLLVRDHLGVKPLYYYHGNGRFLFASEIKGILASGMYDVDVDWQSVSDYFTYLYVPSPSTVFHGIRQIPPGHLAELDLRTNEMTLRRYWHPGGGDGGSTGSGPRSREDSRARLRELITDSVKLQLVSDVPLGVFLSGGVDSPILTALMAETSPHPVNTFTVRFQGRDVGFYDEGELARIVANRYGTVHREIVVDITEPAEMLDLVRFFDQPFGNPTFYLMHLISKAARPEIKVALCGAGGDELFAGYPRYRAFALSRWLRWMPAPLLAGARRLIEAGRDGHRMPTMRRARRFLGGLDDDFVRQFVRWTYFLDDREKRLLLGDTALAGGDDRNGALPAERVIRRKLEESRLEDFGNRILEVDLQTFLPDNVLEYTDKMSMAVGLEVRVPYLDHRVVQHSLTIPFSEKLSWTGSKVVLKETFADLLPTENRKARKKGFNVPLAVWMRDELDEYFDVAMSRGELARCGILRWEFIELLRQQHRTGKRDNSYELFAIMMFDVWYRRYVLQEDPTGLLGVTKAI